MTIKQKIKHKKIQYIPCLGKNPISA